MNVQETPFPRLCRDSIRGNNKRHGEQLMQMRFNKLPERSQRLATMDGHCAQSATTQFGRNTRAIVLLDLAPIKLTIISESPSSAQRLCKILTSADAAQDEDLTSCDLIQCR